MWTTHRTSLLMASTSSMRPHDIRTRVWMETSSAASGPTTNAASSSSKLRGWMDPKDIDSAQTGTIDTGTSRPRGRPTGRRSPSPGSANARLRTMASTSSDLTGPTCVCWRGSAVSTSGRFIERARCGRPTVRPWPSWSTNPTRPCLPALPMRTRTAEIRRGTSSLAKWGSARTSSMS